MRNSEIPEIYRLPHLEVAICMVGEGDSPATKGEFEFEATALLTLQEAVEAYVVTSLKMQICAQYMQRGLC